MRRGWWRDDLGLLRIVGWYLALATPVYVAWNLVMNGDDWSTAISHGVMFSIATTGVVILWAARRAARRAAAVPTDQDAAR